MKKFLSLFLSLIMVLALLPAVSLAEEEAWWEEDYWSEEVLLSLGAELPAYNAAEGVYEISKPEQLLYLSGLWKPEDSNADGVADAPCDGTYVLTADLDMSDLLDSIGTVISSKSGTKTEGYMPPIAASVDELQEEGIHCGFFGTFEGNYHVISNLRIVRMGSKYAGLFGNIGHDYGIGYVRNLALVNMDVVGAANSGLLCGSLQGDVDNCVVIGTVTVTEKTAGGIAGKVKKNDAGYESNVRNCFVWCDITVLGQGSENGSAGGVCGAQSNGGRIYNCYVGGSITVEDEGAQDIGGISGNLKNGQAVENMVMLLKSIDTETGTNTGLLVGNYGSESGSHINNNYVFEGTVVNGCPTSAHPDAACYSIVTADDLCTESFYLDKAGWDMESIWTCVKTDDCLYPMLQGFAENALVTDGLAAKVADTLRTTALAVRTGEPAVNTAYQDEQATLSMTAYNPAGAAISDVQVAYGTSKDPAELTETVACTEAGDGSFVATLPVLAEGTYYYVFNYKVDGKDASFPSNGAIRLDIVSSEAKYAPKYLTVAPGTDYSSVGINFITESEGLTGELRYRLAGGNEWTVLPAEQYSVQLSEDADPYVSYSCDVTGLAADTAYEYMAAVTADGSTYYQSDIHTFTTLPDDGSFSFIVVSDMQGTSEEAYDPFYYTMNGFVADTLGGVDMVINLGDMTENDTDAEWSYLFTTIGDVLADNIVAYVAGNHECKRTATYENFKALTNLPGGIDDAAIGETTASFVVGDVCFVILNTEPYSGLDGADTAADKVAYYEAQKAWAAQCFEESGCTYRIICAHAGLVQDDAVATDFLIQMCDELDVDMYFNGHIHNYFRANTLGGEKTDVGTGTAYVTTSPMGIKFDPYEGEIDDILQFQTGGTDDERQYFTYVQVTPDGINVTAYQRSTDEAASKSTCAEYEVIDSFSLKTSDKQAEEEPVAEETAEVANETPADAAPAAGQTGSKANVGLIVGISVAAVVVIAVVVVLVVKKKKN